MKSSFLQLWLLLHHSSLTKHLGVLSLNNEISCVHINQPLSSKKAQFSPRRLFLKVKALPQEGKKTFPFSFSDILHDSLFPFKCYSPLFIPCSPITKMILLRQRQAKYSVVSSCFFHLPCFCHTSEDLIRSLWKTAKDSFVMIIPLSSWCCSATHLKPDEHSGEHVRFWKVSQERKCY